MNQMELSERLWNLATRIGNVVDALPDTRMGRHVAGQLVRSDASSALECECSGRFDRSSEIVKSGIGHLKSEISILRIST